ncbi:MAG: hypothetical protein KAH77_09830 [Thiomargarita sp.]|nr:hypothetical protein [Thiomargarita sp.]
MPEKERLLWRLFDKIPFENQIALENLNADQVLNCLDYPSYFELTEQNLPSNKNGILQQLEAEKMIIKNQSGHWNIYNLGAILFAKDLALFPELRKLLELFNMLIVVVLKLCEKKKQCMGMLLAFFMRLILLIFYCRRVKLLHPMDTAKICHSIPQLLLGNCWKIC